MGTHSFGATVSLSLNYRNIIDFLKELFIIKDENRETVILKGEVIRKQDTSTQLSQL